MPRTLEDILNFRPVPPAGRENHFLWSKELTGYLNDAYAVYLAGISKPTMTEDENTYWCFALNLIAEITGSRAEYIKRVEAIESLPQEEMKITQ
jgi:hypothetical protein